MGRHFKVKKYHDSLKYFLEQRLSSEQHTKWVTNILGYDFEIIYKKGKLNVVADALSRKDEEVEALLCAIYIIQPDWIIEARDEWKKDEQVLTLIQKLQQDPSTSSTFSCKNDSLWYKSMLPPLHSFLRVHLHQHLASLFCRLFQSHNPTSL